MAIFTDSLTEVGASRRDMLGIEGVADLIAEGEGPEEAGSVQAMAAHLPQKVFAGVEAFAEIGVRDDMCLLVGLVH